MALVKVMDIFEKLLLLRMPGVGRVKYAELIKSQIPILHTQDHIDSVKREIEHAERAGITYICTDSEYYPENLKNIKDRPPIISVRGNPETLKRLAVGIVGTRHATAAGMRFISDIAKEFANNGMAVVSGMAMGTDTAAHTGALLSDSDACTIAVLAGGVDNIWPLENEKLYNQIIERGCVVSEMPFGTKPNRGLFINRNRVIAGIAESLVLGEADEKSGSVATAKFAIGYNRTVFAVPSHPSDERSVGPNRLIAKGDAKIITSVNDFFIDNKNKSEIENKKLKIENEVLSKLSNIPLPESVLAELVKKTVGEVRRELVMLELSGAVRKANGGYVLC